jgi:methylated-DNA-[protein]-cysteine S-methyltransferase
LRDARGQGILRAMPAQSVPTPFGPITLLEAGEEIVSVAWKGGRDDRSPLLDAAAEQLAAYFAGTLRAFDLPLAVGTGITAAFLQALIAIPFGQTQTYGELARDLGVSAQAVGQMCGANRLPILIPCHRVLGASTLGGYSAPGGIETKVALLRHEGAAGLLI